MPTLDGTTNKRAIASKTAAAFSCLVDIGATYIVILVWYRFFGPTSESNICDSVAVQFR